MRNIEPYKPSAPAAAEIETIAHLLMEYSKRLDDLVRRVEGYRYRRTTFGVILIGALGVMISLAIWDAHFAADGLVFVAPLIVAFGASLGIGAFSVFGVDRRRERVLRGDIQIAARHLARVVRLGEQLQQHAVTDSASRLELELRLTDAITTLHYADYDSRADYTAARVSAP